MKYDIYEDYEYEKKFNIEQWDVFSGFIYLIIDRDKIDLDKVHDILVEKCSINPIIVATGIKYLTDYKCKNSVLIGDVKMMPRLLAVFKDSIIMNKDLMKEKYELVKKNKYFGKYIDSI